MDKPKIQLIYELLMSILAIISVSFIFIEETSYRWIDTTVWLIFVVDVSVRLFYSKSKWEYIKKNPFDIIAILPLDSIFRLARVARVIRVIRALSIISKSFKPVFDIINTNGLNKVITATIVLIFISSIPIYYLEPNIKTYGDAFWWSIVTATTVGYGDISPETGLGRLIAIILMLFGIGLIGMITGSIATYFIGEKKQKENVNIVYIKGQLDRFDELNEKDIEIMMTMLDRLKEEKGRDYRNQ